MSRWFTIIVLSFEAAVFVTLCYSTSLESSATYDEGDHLLAGYVKLKAGDFRFLPEHPHLSQVWAALPVTLMRTRAPWESATPEEWRTTEMWLIRDKWMWQDNDPSRLLTPARFMISLLGLLLGGGVVTVAWLLERGRAGVGGAEVAGARGTAVIAGAIYFLCPVMIAHGSLVTTDMAAGLGSFAACASFVPFMRRPGVLSAVVAGVGSGVAAMLKLSFLLMLPGIGLWWLLSAAGRARRESLNAEGSMVWRVAACVVRDMPLVALAIACAGAFVWACYGFRYSSMPGRDGKTPEFRFLIATEEKPEDQWEYVLRDAGWMGGAVRFARAHRLLPESFLWGLGYAKYMVRGRATYFMGKTSFEGSAAYFPVLFALKTPLPTLILLLIGALGVAREMRTAGMRRAAGSMIRSAWGEGEAGCGACWRVGATCMAAAYAVSAVNSDLNIGHRHLLPIYPFLYVAAGLAAGKLVGRSRGDRIGLAVLGLWYAGGAAMRHPDELAYFNELILDWRNAGFVAADSNLDWGQDVKKLARLQRERGWEEIKFSYFGVGDPAVYGVRASYLPSLHAPKNAKLAAVNAGVYAISLSCLRLAAIDTGMTPYLNDWTPAAVEAFARLKLKVARAQADPAFVMAEEEIEFWNRLVIARLFTALRDREPDAIAGRSIYVYVLDEEELGRIIGS